MGFEFRKFFCHCDCGFTAANCVCRGGSEDVMLDLMIRQLVRNYQKKTKELEKSRESRL